MLNVKLDFKAKLILMMIKGVRSPSDVLMLLLFLMCSMLKCFDFSCELQYTPNNHVYNVISNLLHQCLKKSAIHFTTP